MENLLSRFARDEDGAVTVDWVVLTAAIVGLGIGVVTLIADGAINYSSSLGSHVGATSIATY
ncbi:hypothetical protein [Vannielia sp.]|uniref:Flp family type IVb pilin n=1 Tax=Vannielia sp. TaxID=2813045 RepID=UPI00262DFA77|nr:hypothetical protein [Vannielia sp.]MDF1872264.1 hypothetical protein [Vannielia sp.]